MLLPTWNNDSDNNNEEWLNSRIRKDQKEREKREEEEEEAPQIKKEVRPCVDAEKTKWWKSNLRKNRNENFNSFEKHGRKWEAFDSPSNSKKAS